MGLLSFMLNIMDPFNITSNYVIEPIKDICHIIFDDYKTRTQEGVNTTRDIILRVIIALFAAVIIVCTASFLYIAFYYAYMPSVLYTQPVYMQFKTCDELKGPCTFPSAHVSLTKKQHLLMVGQSYRIFLNFDLPESPVNQEIGMFMVCAELRDSATTLRGHSCRSTMLRYRSNLVKWIETWITSPLLLVGIKEERQYVSLELFSNFEDDQIHPVTDVYIEIQSKVIQFYSVSLHIVAHFAGLRFIMFHWPFISAAIGISINLFFISFICLLSWYHWSDTAWIDEAKEKYKKMRIKSIDLEVRSDTPLSSTIKKNLDYDCSSSIDDTINILNDEDFSMMELQMIAKATLQTPDGLKHKKVLEKGESN